MLIKLLLLLAFGLKQATAICFHNEPSNVKRNVTGRPKAVDDYHCKILCVENTDCLTYIFPENECFLLGKPAYDADTTCIKQYYEMVKKVDDGDCPDAIPQPKVDDEYKPIPALALATPLVDVLIDKLHPLPAGPYILDILLPDNSHQVEANYNRMISWDEKLGSWVLTKQSRTAGVDANTTTYIRAAKGFTFNTTDFSDPASCGGNIPTMDIPIARQSVYESMGPAQPYTPYSQRTDDLCPVIFLQIHDVSDETESSMNSITSVSCIDGAWIMQSANMLTRKLVGCTCVKIK